MEFRTICTALAVTAALGCGMAAAQDKTGTNRAAEGTGSRGAVAQMALAQQLYAAGLADKDALTVLAAARLAAAVSARDVDQKKETKAIDGADQTESGTGADTPADAAAMLASARDLAGGDEVILSLIDDAEAEGARGRVGGASQTLSRLPAGQSDVWEIPYFGGSLAEVAIMGDGDADLDVTVADENGNTICYDVSYTDKIYCDWVPAWNGYFFVTVENRGVVRNSYYLMTN